MDPTLWQRLQQMLGMGGAAPGMATPTSMPTDPVSMSQYMTPNETANLAATSGMASPMENPQPSAQENLFSALSSIKAPPQPEAPRVSAPPQYNGPQARDPSELLALILGRQSANPKPQAGLSTLLGR